MLRQSVLVCGLAKRNFLSPLITGALFVLRHRKLLVELLELSDYYGMPLLQSSAAARVLTLVRPWNVCGVLGALQGLPSCGPLAAALERYAARRIRAVVSQSSGELVALSPGAIEGMLRGGDRWLPPTSEDSVCDALTAWVGDDEARATFADCRLVQLVRFLAQAGR